jgi:hypothetical protein
VRGRDYLELVHERLRATLWGAEAKGWGEESRKGKREEEEEGGGK